MYNMLIVEQKMISISSERVFQTISGQKDTNTTILTYWNAGGLHVSPMVISKAACVKP